MKTNVYRSPARRDLAVETEDEPPFPPEAPASLAVSFGLLAVGVSVLVIAMLAIQHPFATVGAYLVFGLAVATFLAIPILRHWRQRKAWGLPRATGGEGRAESR